MNEPMLPRRRPGVQVHISDDEAVLTDPESQAVYRLNPTALAVWELCDGETTLGEAVDSLSDLTGETPNSIRADIETALGEFRSLQLVD